MPYLLAPPAAKFLDRAVLTLQYLACIGMGLLTALIREEPGLSFIGWVILASSVPCALGAVLGRWEIESIGLIPLAAAIVGALVIISLGPTSVVFWVVIAFACALVRQWIRLFLQLRSDLRRRRLLHRLDAGGAR
jgi:predicted cobalt transporter CbtA